MANRAIQATCPRSVYNEIWDVQSRRRLRRSKTSRQTLHYFWPKSGAHRRACAGQVRTRAIAGVFRGKPVQKMRTLRARNSPPIVCTSKASPRLLCLNVGFRRMLEEVDIPQSRRQAKRSPHLDHDRRNSTPSPKTNSAKF